MFRSPLPFTRPLALGLVAVPLALAGTASALTSADAAGTADTTARAAQAGCVLGNVNGFARVRGGSSIPTFYTSASPAVDTRHNCSGGSVQVRRSATGTYFVRFNGNASTLAVVSGNQDGASTAFSGDVDNIVTSGKITSGSDAGSFRVDVVDADNNASNGTRAQDGQFTIMLL